MTPPPTRPKLYHIAHLDHLPSILADECLVCDAEIHRRATTGGTVIGMDHIKQRRLTSPLRSHADLHVGDCVPFYFCPRSVMLYLISRRNNAELAYTGGQVPIIHLAFDLYRVVEWAESLGLRWAFTLSNAGSSYFEDRADLKQLREIDWNAIRATDWRDPDVKQGEQSEFLAEERVSWNLVERIGVMTSGIGQRTGAAISRVNHQPQIEVKRDWYY